MKRHQEVECVEGLEAVHYASRTTCGEAGLIRIVAVIPAANNNTAPQARNAPLNPIIAFVAPAATAMTPPANVPAKFKNPKAVARKLGGIPSQRTGIVLPSYIPLPIPKINIAP